MTIIEELNKACQETAQVATGLLKKSQMGFDFSGTAHDHHAAYTRTSASGKVSQIQAKGATPAKAEHTYKVTPIKNGPATNFAVQRSDGKYLALNGNQMGHSKHAHKAALWSKEEAHRQADKRNSTTDGDATRDKHVLAAAQNHMNIDDLTEQHSDREDFKEISTWSMKHGLYAAYTAGKGGKQMVGPSQGGKLQEIAKKHFGRDFTEHGRDADDFHEHHVNIIRDALNEAYDHGIKIAEHNKAFKAENRRLKNGIHGGAAAAKIATERKPELQHGDLVNVRQMGNGRQIGHIVRPEGNKTARVRYEGALGSTELDPSDILEHHPKGSATHAAIIKQHNPHDIKRGDWVKDAIGNHYKVVRDVSPTGDTTLFHKEDAMNGTGTGISHNTKYLNPAPAPADYVPKQKKTKTAEPTIADKKAVAAAQGMIEGNAVSIKSGFGEGKEFRIKNVNITNGTVTGEVTVNANFYPVTLRYDEVNLVPGKQTPHNVLERAGMKHKPGEGYKPELDPYQNHYGSTTHADIHKHLADAGYRYTKKGSDWHFYERSAAYAHDNITLHVKDGKITRATSFSGPVRD